MMPPLQYTTSADGTRIAYWQIGNGPPLVITSDSHTGNIELEWEIPTVRHWYGRLAAHHRVIRFDARGSGNSDREVTDLSQPALAADLRSVIRAAAPDGASVFARLYFGPAAILVAEAEPHLVSHLVLWLSGARPLLVDEIAKSWYTIALSDWAAVCDGMTRSLIHAEGEDVEPALRAFLASTTPEMARRWQRARQDDDVREHLGRVQQPALVLTRRRNSLVKPDLSRELAAGLPHAQLTTFDGESTWPMFEGGAAIADRVLEFLADAHAPQSSPAAGFRTILFTDVVASTPLLAQLKDAKMREVMRDHDAVLEAAVQEHGGRVVKEIGDAFMAEFAVPSAAVACAIAIQRRIRAKFPDSDVPLRLRIGINAGEPVEEDGDLHGASVVIAKRLESAAPEDGILIADGVKQLLAGKDFTFVDRGLVDLKGFDEPVRAWSVEWA